MEKSKFKVLAPLSNFNWSGKCFQIDDFCFIEKLDKIPDLSWFDRSLSNDDKEELSEKIRYEENIMGSSFIKRAASISKNHPCRFSDYGY